MNADREIFGSFWKSSRRYYHRRYIEHTFLRKKKIDKISLIFNNFIDFIAGYVLNFMDFNCILGYPLKINHWSILKEWVSGGTRCYPYDLYGAYSFPLSHEHFPWKICTSIFFSFSKNPANFHKFQWIFGKFSKDFQLKINWFLNGFFAEFF